MELQVFAWIIDIFFICTLHIVYKGVLGTKYKNKYILFSIWCLCFLSWNLSSYAFMEMPLINGLCSIIINFAVLCILYKGSIRDKFILVFIVIALGMIAENMTASVFMMTGVDANDLQNMQENYLYLGSAVSKVIWFMFVKLISLISAKRKHARIGLVDWVEIFLVPCGSLIIYYAVGWKDYYEIDLPRLVIWVVLLVINLVTYYIYQKIQENAVLTLNEEMLKQQNMYYRMRYEDTQEQWLKLRKMRHDMANNYVLEQTYLENQQYDLLKEHYLTMLGTLKNQENIINTGNIGIDSIINYKIEAARESGIAVSKEIKVAGNISISNGDLNVLIGNLFDNAIEAAKKLEDRERKISLKLKTDSTALYFCISNNFRGKTYKNYQGEYISSKPDKNKHGIGLKSVKDMVQKYNGTMDIEETDREFIVKIFLYM